MGQSTSRPTHRANLPILYQIKQEKPPESCRKFTEKTALDEEFAKLTILCSDIYDELSNICRINSDTIDNILSKITNYIQDNKTLPLEHITDIVNRIHIPLRSADDNLVDIITTIMEGEPKGSTRPAQVFEDDKFIYNKCKANYDTEFYNLICILRNEIETNNNSLSLQTLKTLISHIENYIASSKHKNDHYQTQLLRIKRLLLKLYYDDIVQSKIIEIVRSSFHINHDEKINISLSTTKKKSSNPQQCLDFFIRLRKSKEAHVNHTSPLWFRIEFCSANSTQEILHLASTYENTIKHHEKLKTALFYRSIYKRLSMLVKNDSAVKNKFEQFNAINNILENIIVIDYSEWFKFAVLFASTINDFHSILAKLNEHNVDKDVNKYKVIYAKIVQIAKNCRQYDDKPSYPEFKKIALDSTTIYLSRLRPKKPIQQSHYEVLHITLELKLLFTKTLAQLLQLVDSYKPIMSRNHYLNSTFHSCIYQHIKNIINTDESTKSKFETFRSLKIRLFNAIGMDSNAWFEIELSLADTFEKLLVMLEELNKRNTHNNDDKYHRIHEKTNMLVEKGIFNDPSSYIKAIKIFQIIHSPDDDSTQEAPPSFSLQSIFSCRDPCSKKSISLLRVYRQSRLRSQSEHHAYNKVLFSFMRTMPKTPKNRENLRKKHPHEFKQLDDLFCLINIEEIPDLHTLHEHFLITRRYISNSHISIRDNKHNGDDNDRLSTHNDVLSGQPIPYHSDSEYDKRAIVLLFTCPTNDKLNSSYFTHWLTTPSPLGSIANQLRIVICNEIKKDQNNPIPTISDCKSISQQSDPDDSILKFTYHILATLSQIITDRNKLNDTLRALRIDSLTKAYCDSLSCLKLELCFVSELDQLHAVVAAHLVDNKASPLYKKIYEHTMHLIEQNKLGSVNKYITIVETLEIILQLADNTNSAIPENNVPFNILLMCHKSSESYTPNLIQRYTQKLIKALLTQKNYDAIIDLHKEICSNIDFIAKHPHCQSYLDEVIHGINPRKITTLMRLDYHYSCIKNMRHGNNYPCQLYSDNKQCLNSNKSLYRIQHIRKVEKPTRKSKGNTLLISRISSRRNYSEEPKEYGHYQRAIELLCANKNPPEIPDTFFAYNPQDEPQLSATFKSLLLRIKQDNSNNDSKIDIKLLKNRRLS